MTGPEPGPGPVVTLLTDYGLNDDFVGVCHGVILGIAPRAVIVDITHGIPRHDVRRGAIALRAALRFMPVGFHVAVVDPQVGAERRAVAVRCDDDRTLIGPDNGLLSLAWEACGGAVDAVEVTRSRHRLEPVSATFHGRDLFAPVAAHLAAGADLADAGQRLEPAELVRLELPRPRVESGALVAHVLTADAFGNLSLDVVHADLAGTGLTLGRAVEIEAPGGRHEGTFAQTFADVAAGGILVYEDAHRHLALAVNRGDAARTLGLAVDDEVRISPR